MINRKFNEYLVLFCLLILPLYSIFFGFKESPLDYTFSMIGNWYDNRINFIIWGVITALLLFISIIHIYNKTKFKNKSAYRYLYYSLIFLVLTVITPTVHSEPVYNEFKTMFNYINFHGFFGVLFGIFLMTSLFLFSKFLSTINKNLSISSFKYLFITIGGSLLTLFLFGMTGVFELFFFLSLSLFLLIINIKTKKFINFK